MIVVLLDVLPRLIPCPRDAAVARESDHADLCAQAIRITKAKGC